MNKREQLLYRVKKKPLKLKKTREKNKKFTLLMTCPADWRTSRLTSRLQVRLRVSLQQIDR